MSKEINKRALISAAILNLSLINGVFAMEDQGAQNPQFAVPDLGKLLSAVSDTNVAQQADLLFDQEVTAELPVQQKVEPQKPAINNKTPKIILLEELIASPQKLMQKINPMEAEQRGLATQSIQIACVRYSKYLRELNNKPEKDQILGDRNAAKLRNDPDLLMQQSVYFTDLGLKVVASGKNPIANRLEEKTNIPRQAIFVSVRKNDKAFIDFINTGKVTNLKN